MGKTEVPAIYESFVAEKKQVLYELITRPEPNLKVSIEDKEDVSIEIGNYLELIQVKSSTADSTQPLADVYPDFWKTLCHWIDKTKTYGAFKIGKYRYSVSSEHDIKIGEIASLFKKAQGTNEAAIVLAKIRNRFHSDSLTIPKNYADKLFAPENEEIVVSVISLFTYEVHSNFQDELKELFYRQGTHKKSHNEAIFNSLSGWLDDQVAPFTQKGKPAHVFWRDFHKEAIAQADRFVADPLASTINNPDDKEVAQEVDRSPIYLRQLDFIDIGDEEKLEAVIDTLRCSKQIHEWSESLEVVDKGLRQYDDTLFAKWHSIAKLCRIEEPNEKNAGQKTYYKTKEGAIAIALQGKAAPPFISHGRLNNLASNPPLSPRIGWHPRYIERLGANDKDN